MTGVRAYEQDFRTEVGKDQANKWATDAVPENQKQLINRMNVTRKDCMKTREYSFITCGFFVVLGGVEWRGGAGVE